MIRVEMSERDFKTLLDFADINSKIPELELLYSILHEREMRLLETRYKQALYRETHSIEKPYST